MSHLQFLTPLDAQHKFNHFECKQCFSLQYETGQTSDSCLFFFS